LDVDYSAALAVGYPERGIADFPGLLTEDRAQEPFLGRLLGLAFRRNLADQDVARLDFGPDADDALFIEVTQGVLAGVRNVAGDFLRAELGVSSLDLVLFNVDRGELVVPNDGLAQD